MSKVIEYYEIGFVEELHRVINNLNKSDFPAIWGHYFPSYIQVKLNALFFKARDDFAHYIVNEEFIDSITDCKLKFLVLDSYHRLLYGNRQHWIERLPICKICDYHIPLFTANDREDDLDYGIIGHTTLYYHEVRFQKLVIGYGADNCFYQLDLLALILNFCECPCGFIYIRTF